MNDWKGDFQTQEQAVGSKACDSVSGTLLSEAVVSYHHTNTGEERQQAEQ